MNSVTDAAGNPATGIVIHKKIEVAFLLFFGGVGGVPLTKKIAEKHHRTSRCIIPCRVESDQNSGYRDLHSTLYYRYVIFKPLL